VIIELPNYLCKNTVNQLKNAIRPFVAGQLQHTYNRDGITVNISKTPELKDTDSFLLNICGTLQKSVVGNRYKPRPDLVSGDSGYEYHIYRPGDICHYHADYEFSNGDTETTLRYASVVMHLNTVQNGGELIFPDQNKKIKTEEGKVVIFPPYGCFGHYTTPSEEPREVIVTWFTYNNLKVVGV
jgi:hypothetical protein